MKDNLSKPNNFLEECLFSNKKNSNTIFVAGDSHAESQHILLVNWQIN